MYLTMRTSKNRSFKKGIKYAFVVDGECEAWYISMLKRNEKNITVRLSPEIPQKKSLKDQYDKIGRAHV